MLIFALVNLIDEIRNFLTGCGISSISMPQGNLSVIQACIKSDDERQRSRIIIPVETRASDIREAETYRDDVIQVISTIREEHHHYPLIVTEDRWRLMGDLMRKRLLSHLEMFTHVYARNCEVRKIDKETAARFLSANHSYGDAACRHRYGLFFKRHTGAHIAPPIAPGTLVAVATFSNARKWIKGDKIIRSYEWTRYASLPEVRVTGGMGKLLQAFMEDIHPDDIMSYADLEWSEGNVYELLGFRKESYKDAVTFRIDDNMRIPLSKSVSTHEVTAQTRYFKNFGSMKYRLKLTDYK